MKRQCFNLIVVVLSFIISSVSFYKGYSQTDTQLEEFNSIDVSGWVTVDLRQGNDFSVKIEGTDQSAKAVKINIKNKKLNISGGMPDKKSVVVVTCKDLNSISSSGAGSFIKSSEPFKSDELSITLNGIAKADMNLDVRSLTTKISGASMAVLKGAASVHNIKGSGASVLNASELQTSRTFAKVSGACNVNLNVKDSLIGNASGASNISCKNEPAFKKIKITGVANIDVEVLNENEIIETIDLPDYIQDDSMVINHKKSDNGDTVKIKMGKKRVIIINENRESKSDTTAENKNKKEKQQIFWSGVGLGFNGYSYSKNSLEVPGDDNFLELNYGKSINVNINPLEWHLTLIKNHVNLVSGLGLEINNYRFENNYTLNPEAKTISAVKNDTMKFKKNKLTTAWIDLPLLLQFDTKKLHKNSTLHLSAGIVGALRINSHTKQVYDYKGKTYKPKSHDDFNQESFRVSAMLRVGYGKVDLYATYALNSMFKSGQGPELYPFSVGINLVNF